MNERKGWTDFKNDLECLRPKRQGKGDGLRGGVKGTQNGDTSRPLILCPKYEMRPSPRRAGRKVRSF
jgi:hypothetical protein